MIIFVILGVLVELIALACGIIILVNAFMDETWKGIVALLCGVYLFYWALFEFENDYKWHIVAGWLGGGFIGGSLVRIGGSTIGWG